MCCTYLRLASLLLTPVLSLRVGCCLVICWVAADAVGCSAAAAASLESEARDTANSTTAQSTSSETPSKQVPAPPRRTARTR